MISNKKRKKIKKLHGKEPFLVRAIRYDKILQVIYDKILAPLANAVTLPEEDSEVEARKLDIVMSGGYRYIREYVVKKDIQNMPGKYYITGANAVINGGKRSFPSGWRALVCVDERIKAFVRVEMFYRWENDTAHVFQLTPAEFKSIVPYLTEPKRSKK